MERFTGKNVLGSKICIGADWYIKVNDERGICAHCERGKVFMSDSGDVSKDTLKSFWNVYFNSAVVMRSEGNLLLRVWRTAGSRALWV